MLYPLQATCIRMTSCHYSRAWRLILVDQRNHGNSASGFSPPHTLQAAAQDLIDLVHQKFNSQQIAAIVGHSLGGKTTLAFLRELSQGRTGLQNPHQVCCLSDNPCFFNSMLSINESNSITSLLLPVASNTKVSQAAACVIGTVSRYKVIGF